jgi:hypothetical protein
MSHLKQLTFKGTLQMVFICLRPPPLLGFCLGWYGKFVGSEFGQKQSVKFLQNMVSNRTRYPPPPYSLAYLFTQEGGRVGGDLNQREG